MFRLNVLLDCIPECQNQGVCNTTIGECICQVGWTSSDCSVLENVPYADTTLFIILSVVSFIIIVIAIVLIGLLIRRKYRQDKKKKMQQIVDQYIARGGDPGFVDQATLVTDVQESQQIDDVKTESLRNDVGTVDDDEGFSNKPLTYKPSKSIDGGGENKTDTFNIGNGKDAGDVFSDEMFMKDIDGEENKLMKNAKYSL